VSSRVGASGRALCPALFLPKMKTRPSSAADDGPAALKAPVEDRILSRARGCEFCSLLHASHITCGRFHNHLTLLIDALCIHADDTRASIRCQNIVSKPFLWMMDNSPGGPDFPAFSFCGALSGPRPGVCSEGEAGATSPRGTDLLGSEKARRTPLRQTPKQHLGQIRVIHKRQERRIDSKQRRPQHCRTGQGSADWE
jgi:hypothetical protein